MISSEKQAKAWIGDLGETDTDGMARLKRLVTLLIIENERQNLVSASSLCSVWQRHIADSAQLLKYVPRETMTWLDLGTGAGFPGIIVAALRPDLQVTMVESRPRRVAWLSYACTELELTHAKVFGHRVEDMLDRTFDVISARAFAPLARLLDLSARFSTSATKWLLPKGRSAAQELAELQSWQHSFHVEPSLTDADAGIIVGNLIGRKGPKL